MRRLVALPLPLALLAVPLAACPEGPDATAVVREVNGAFSPDGSELVIVESRYTTTDPSAPYYADGSASDPEIVLQRAPADDLDAREVLLRRSDPTFGAIQDTAAFWLPSKRRFVWYQAGEPFVPWLVDVDTGTQTELALPDDVWSDLLAVAAFPPGRHHAIPSPDGEHLGVFTATRTPTAYVLNMSFFDTDDGAHRKTVELDWPEKNIHPWLVSPEGLQHPLLWAQDGSGVYVLDCEHAVFVPVDATADVVEVNEVPSFAAPTHGGVVNDEGTRVWIDQSGNDAALTLAPWGAWPVYGATPPSQWVAFDDVTLVPLSEVAYCQPR